MPTIVLRALPMMKKSIELPFQDRLPPLTVPVVIVVALLLGAIIPAYVTALGDGYAKLAALPALIALVILVIYSRVLLLLLIMLLRGATEGLFEATRFAIGGAQIGLGGLLNIFAVLIALLLIVEKPKVLSTSIFKIWAPFVIMLFVGVSLSPDTTAGIRLCWNLLSHFAIFVGAFYCVKSDEQFRGCIKLVLWSSVIPVVFGIVQFATGTGMYSDDAGMRINSTFSHGNVFGFYLVLTTSLMLYVLKHKAFELTAGKRWVLTLCLFLMMALLILTKTRSAWLACFALFAGYGLIFERRYLIYIAIAAVAGLFIPGVSDRLADLSTDSNAVSAAAQTNSFTWRMEVWKSGLGWMEPSHYLTGYGLDSFPYYVTTFFKDSYGVHSDAHNVYVQLFFEVGMLGLLSFIWMYGQVLRYLKVMIGFDRLGAYILIMLVVEYLIVAYSDNMLFYQSFNWYMWFTLGAGVSLVVSKQAAAAGSRVPSTAIGHPS